MHDRFARSCAVLLVACGVLATCGGDDPAGLDPAAAVFEVRVADDETFRFAVTDPDLIAEAEALVASGAETIVAADLAHGNGGHNAPYSWHLVAATVHFPEQTIEACSGRPLSDVQADVAYWVDNLGQYCPWSSVIIRRVR